MPHGTNGLKKRSVRIGGHDTSITLEEPFWNALRDIAAAQNVSVNALISEIDENRNGNLSSALRVYILQHLQDELRNK